MGKTIKEVLAKTQNQAIEFKAIAAKGDPFAKIRNAPDSAFDKTTQAIKGGKSGNTSLDFMDKKQTMNGKEYPLGDTYIKAKIKGSDKPESFRIGKEDTLDSTVYAGGEDNAKCAFMLARDPDGKDNRIDLDEFHSLTTKTTGTGELGIMTSYSNKTGQVYTGTLEGHPNLDTVKQLMISDCAAPSNNEQLKLKSGENSDE
jgi:hypothetical protein